MKRITPATYADKLAIADACNLGSCGSRTPAGREESSGGLPLGVRRAPSRPAPV